MSQNLRVVVSCTDRKRLPTPPDLQLRTYADDLSERAAAWTTRIGKPAGPKMRAVDLYQGEHWSVVQELADTASAVGVTLDLWIASAGYGLICPEDRVEPYAATFSTRNEDSVTRSASTSSPSNDARFWWGRLSDRHATNDAPRTLAALAAQDPTTPMIVALSSTYVRAVRDDVLIAAAAMKKQSNLMMVSGKASDPELQEFLLPVDARFQHLVGGTRMSLNARVTKHIIEQADKHYWDGDLIHKVLGEDLELQPEIVQYGRRALSDDEVRQFIKENLAKQSGASRSALLRQLRDQDLACEQKRFGRLYGSVLERTCQ